MTQNQLQYQANFETNRSNLAKELETKRNNIATLEETIRSNKARENEQYRYNTLYLNELGRSNRAREQYQLLSLDETKRHNQVQEAYQNASVKLEKYKADNAMYLGLGNLGISKESSLYQNELIQQRTETEKQNTAKTRKEVSLTGAKSAEARQHILFMQAQTKTENELRNARKTQSYTTSFNNVVGPIARVIPSLFGGD